MDTFINGKKYIFSRDKWLADTGNVLLYKGNPHLRQEVDKSDGKEVKNLNEIENCGFVGSLIVYPEECDIIESKRRTSFRKIVAELKRDDWNKLLAKINELEDVIEAHRTSIFILENEQRRALEKLKRLEERG